MSWRVTSRKYSCKQQATGSTKRRSKRGGSTTAWVVHSAGQLLFDCCCRHMAAVCGQVQGANKVTVLPHCWPHSVQRIFSTHS
jgi:hypothetical protein